ncbi:MAG: hypothetical protein R3C01_09910 [Planctomycetaceae bacterium]
MNKPMIAGGGLMMLSSVVWFFWGILALGLLFRAAVILFAFGAFAVYQGVKGEDA